MIPSRVYQPADSMFPLLGVNERDQSTFMNPRYSPSSEDVIIEDGVMKKRTGYIQHGDTFIHAEPVLAIIQMTTIGGTNKLTALTTRNQYLYDESTETWRLMGEVLEDFNSKADWTAGAGVALADESTIAKYGNSMKITIDDAAGADLKIAYSNTITNVDTSDYNILTLWIYSSVALDAADYSIFLSEDADGAKTNATEHEIPAIAATTWTAVRIAITSGKDDVESIGIWQNTDNSGEVILYLDDLRISSQWTGDEDDYVLSTIGMDESGRYVVATNGRDWPLWWNGSDATWKKLEVDLASFVTCRALGVFQNRLWMGNVKRTSVEPQAFYWSAAGDWTDWTGIDTGGALLSDASGAIQGLVGMGDRLAIYAEDSIGFVSYVGGDVLYAFETVVRGSRLVSPRTIISIGPYHFFMSQESFHVFDGSRDLKSIGSLIDNRLRKYIDLSEAAKAHGFYDLATKIIYWVVPRGLIPDTCGRTSETYRLELNLQDLSTIKWDVVSFIERPTCFGYFAQQGNLAWDSGSLSGVSWEEMVGAWESLSSQASFPVLASGNTTGEVFLHTGVAKTDNGSSVDAKWDSIDFTVPQIYQSLYGRWGEIELDLRGDFVDVSYSLDQGATYTVVETLTLNKDWTRHKVYVDKVNPTFRVRLSKNSSTAMFEMRWLRVWVSPGGSR